MRRTRYRCTHGIRLGPSGCQAVMYGAGGKEERQGVHLARAVHCGQRVSHVSVAVVVEGGDAEHRRVALQHWRHCVQEPDRRPSSV